MRWTLLIAAFVLLLAPSLAGATGRGPVTIVAVQPAQPSSGCAYFEVRGDPPNSWIAISVYAASFNSSFGAILSAFMAGAPITFATSGTLCGYPALSWLYLGTAN